MVDTLALATVVYKNYDVLDDFLKSLEAQVDTRFHVFVADASPEKKKIHSQFPMTVIPIDNLGYAYGINTCIHNAHEQGYSRYCIINDDTYFRPDFVSNVMDSLNQNPHSLVGGKIYYARGYEYHKDRYKESDLGQVLWYAGGQIDWNHATTSHIGVDEVDIPEFSVKRETDFITGCLICMDDVVLEKVGYLDTSYFMYYEDSDYCVRAKKAGIPLLYDPHIMIWHKNGQSTGGSGSETHVEFQRKSHLKFALKYAPWRTKLHVIKNYYQR